MFKGYKVAFVEDDASVRDSLVQTLELAGLEVCAWGAAEPALASIDKGFQGIVVTDVRLPGMSGLAFLKEIVALDPTLPVILITGHGDVSMAVEAMHSGAYDFIEKPFPPERLVDIARRALEQRALRVEIESLRQQLQNKRGIEALLLGKSAAIEQLRRQILNLADTSADVLVIGETGTGKELVARCLHDHSMRRKANFVAINCGGLPESLLESELFGHESGAFTAAAKRRIGKIEHAHGGTLMLDEIESMPMSFQVKLLRALQERKIERLGSNEEIHVDFRIVAATKSNLLEMCAAQKFRSDLYYRLSVAELELPPLRERREDIPILFEHFVLQAAIRYSREAPLVQSCQIRDLMAHDWPGNVRELRNVADRFVLGLLGTQDGLLPMSAQGASLTLAEQVDIVEKTLIEQALRKHAGRPVEVSEALGIARKTFYDKIHRHGIVLDQFRA